MMKEINIGNKSIHYEEKNEVPTVICIHGVGSNHKIWEFQVNELARKYRVIAGDCAWHGESISLPVPEKYTIADFSDDWCRVIEHLQLKRSFILGTGLGSVIALQMALDRPEIIKGLILVNTRSHCDDDFCVLLQRQISILDKEGIDKLSEFIVPRFFPDTFIQKYPRIIESYKKWRGEQRVETVKMDCRAFMDFDVRDRLPTLKIPTLFISGEYDIVNPPFCSKGISEKLSNSKYFQLKGCGTMPFLEKPDTFNHLLINFIDNI